MPRTNISLPVSLPVDRDRAAFCVRCLKERLSSRPGIASVRTSDHDPREDRSAQRPGAATLELDYDPTLLSLAQINALLRQAGGCLSESIAHLVLPVEGILSPRQESSIQSALSRLPGVTASASYASQTIRLEFDRRSCALPEIVRRLDELGVRTLTAEQAESRAAARRVTGGRWRRLAGPVLAHPDMTLAVLAGITLLAGTIAQWTGQSSWLWGPLLSCSFVLGGWYPLQGVWEAVRELRLDIDILMFLAAIGAALLGHYAEGAMLLFLFSLGGAGEHLAMERARRAIAALSELRPATAWRWNPDGSVREVRVEDLLIGDRVRVRPGERVPSDGRVVQGASSVDQAAITGESVPVEKTVGGEVFAGTVNGEGVLIVQVSKSAQENTLAKLIRLVAEAQTTKSPTQLFADRVERWYVPVVILATLMVAVLPPLLGLPPRREHASLWAGWFYQAMAFLTAASPCALAIGTPAAVLSGIARAARGGVLIKGGAHLEALGRVRAIAVDKTGTLTRGKLAVTDLVPLAEAVTPERLLALAAALEESSTHPIAEAICAEARARDLTRLTAVNVSQVPGVGVFGEVDGRALSIARSASLTDSLPGVQQARHTIGELQDKARTAVVLADEARVLGVLGLEDEPRPSAAESLARLRRLGVERTIMLTGDNARTAAAVARRVGTDEYLADLLPEDKLAKVKELVRKYQRVAMIGDGVNDAPALAAATVGIAIAPPGSTHSDVALETADVVLMSDDLAKLPEAVGVSRFTRSIITQNLVLALGVIVFLSPAAALGLTPISLAVLFHEGSTVMVVLNSLRILGHRVR